MSKKNQNVLRKSAEALQTIADELDTLNSYLYGVGVELADLNSKIDSLKELIETKLKEPLRVTVDTESLLTTVKKVSEKTKPKEAEIPALIFKPME